MNNLNNSENNLNFNSQLENERKEKKRLEELNTLNELLIDIYKKQNKYLQNLNYEKIIPLSTVSPNIDLLKINSMKMISMPSSLNQIDIIKYKLNKYFFEGTNNISIYNSNAINARVKYLNKNPQLNIIPGFKYYIYKNEIYAFRETYSKYIIDDKDFAQVLYQFDSFDIYRKKIVENICLSSNHSSNFKIPINKPTSSKINQEFTNNMDFKNELTKNKNYTKIANSLANSSKINRFLMEIPISTPNIYNTDYRINVLDIGKIIPSLIKYKDSNILGFNKKEKKTVKENTTSYFITKKSEDQFMGKDAYNHILFSFLFIFQRIIKNINNYDIDIYNLLTYDNESFENENNILVEIISKFNLYKMLFNKSYFIDYYNKNIIYPDKRIFNYYNKLLLTHNETKFLKFNNKQQPNKYTLENYQKTLENKMKISSIIESQSSKFYCLDNSPNYGFIIQLNTGNNIYTNYQNENDIKKNLFTNFNNSKYSQKNFSIHETFQSENPTYACIYVDNNSHKTYFYAPTLEKPKEFIEQRLKLMNFDLNIFNFEDEYYIENEIAHLKFDDSINFSNYSDYLDSFNLMSRNINDIKPEKINGILDDVLSNSNFRLSDLSGLYCLYFLTVMSSNMPNHNHKPISSFNNPFEDFFNKIFRNINDDIFNIENNKQKQKNAYIKHVQNVCDMIGDLLFTQNRVSFAKYDEKVLKFKEEKKELDEKILKKVLTLT